MTGARVLEKAPPCDPKTMFDACRGGCGRQMHSGSLGSVRTCTEGHPRHCGRGLCAACRLRHKRAGTLDQFPPIKWAPAPPAGEEDPEHALDEWEAVGGDFATFGRRVGMTQTAWERIFAAAEDAGDARAVRR